MQTSSQTDAALFSPATNINHTAGIAASVVGDPARVAEIQRILSYYGHPFVSSIRDLGLTSAGSENYEVTTAGEDKFLLRIALGQHAQTSENFLTGMGAFYAILKHAGIASTEYLLPTGTDSPVVQRVGGDTCTLSPWLEAHSYFVGGIKDSAHVGEMLRSVHHALLEAERSGGALFHAMDAACAANAGSAHGRLISWDELEEKIFAKAAESPRSDFRKMLLEFHEDFRCLAGVVAAVITPADLAMGQHVLHRDLTRRNFLFLENGRLALLDAERMQRGNPWLDIGQAAWTVLRETAERDGTSAAKLALKAFSSGYSPEHGLDERRLTAFAGLAVLQSMISYAPNMVSPEGVQRLERERIDGQAVGHCAAAREFLLLMA